MSTFLPRDDDHAPIPALRLKPGGAQKLTLSAASVRTVQPFSARTRVIAVSAPDGAFIRTGGADIVATADDHFLPAGVYLYLSLGDERIGPHRHVAAVAADGDAGTLHVSELE